jgi:type II secretory pathway component PulL
VVNPEKQLDQQLSEFSARSQGVLFTPILAKVTESVASMDDASISSLNFSGSTSEVRLDIVARDYQAVEVLRDRLTQQGMTATLETSSSRADRVRARIRVAASS